MQYATLAVVPISKYASQYGTNSLSVHQTVLTLSVTNLNGVFYNDDNLQQWVNQLAKQPGLPVNPCIVVLSPLGVINTDAAVNRQNVLGYHSRANVPYCFCNVLGENLTVADQANVYAAQLSHEIAEMTVDPYFDPVNPEVCDPCGPNCQAVWLDFFGGQSNTYLQTTQPQTFPPNFAYTFFINAIAQPNSVSQCPPTSSSACAYAPPETRKGLKDQKDVIKEGKEKEIIEKDFKELKDNKDVKEKDFKDHSEKVPKEKDKDKDIIEGPPQGPAQEAALLSAVVADLLVRVENLERRLATGSAFITPSERPAVGQEALRDEGGESSTPKSREA